MARINAAIHHNGIYIISNPQCHSYKQRGSESSRDTERTWMEVLRVVIFICAEL